MNRPIGIFDSGIGGLTVVKELKKQLPNEQLIYFGDTARIPYGTKSKELIRQFAVEDAQFLMQFDIKLLIVACNTASSLAIGTLREHFSLPIVGVVKPGARAAAEKSKNKRIGVIGTPSTINSGAYAEEIRKQIKTNDIYSQACPMLVPLVEEGWLDGEITRLTLEKYLKNLINKDVDTLILGCTHYPLLKSSIEKVTQGRMALIDSGLETAKRVKEILLKENLANDGAKESDDLYFVSDNPQKFQKIGSMFLGEELANVRRIDFEKFLMENSEALKRLSI
jgi:glutamate racemase